MRGENLFVDVDRKGMKFATESRLKYWSLTVC